MLTHYSPNLNAHIASLFQALCQIEKCHCDDSMFFQFSGSKAGCGTASVSKSNLSLHHGSTGTLKYAGIFREADVFLLCYRISDPASLFSAINFWCPEIRCYAPTTPIILVGCQSDLRYKTCKFISLYASRLRYTAGYIILNGYFKNQIIKTFGPFRQ